MSLRADRLKPPPTEAVDAGSGPPARARPSRRSALAFLLALLPAAVLLPHAAAAGLAKPLVLVELFTSEGCSSCPPADALLAELADRPDILALSLHVDYWNRLGWSDPFSDPANSRRQQAYAQRLGTELYTPQLIVDGQAEAIGSDRAAVERRIAAAQTRARGVALEGHLTASDVLDISIRSLLPGQPQFGVSLAGSSIMLATYDERRQTSVDRGENRGRTLAHRHVLRSLRPLALWDGLADHFLLPLTEADRGERLALFLQSGDGAVWAVARIEGPGPDHDA